MIFLITVRNPQTSLATDLGTYSGNLDNKHRIRRDPTILRKGEGWGPLELQLEKRPGVTDKASIVSKHYASHKSKKEAQ